MLYYVNAVACYQYFWIGMQNVDSCILKRLCYELVRTDFCFTEVHVCCAKLKEKLDIEKMRLARPLSSYDY